MSIIELKDINLLYDVNYERKLKDLFVRKPNDSDLLKSKKIHALKNLNLTLRDGDRLGIIGHNGAGKSSLLKLIAGIYPQTTGELTVEGKVSSLFELATGFEMEATGWDNIMLRGLMLGETPKNMKAKAQEIAEFSELGDFLNIPVKHYSSGMFVRLAFSVSTSIKPEILLLDEVIAAGDAKFLAKAQERMKNLVDSVKILIFVTHSLDYMKDVCNKCIWLNNGEIMMFGSPEDVAKSYLGQ